MAVVSSKPERTFRHVFALFELMVVAYKYFWLRLIFTGKQTNVSLGRKMLDRT
jgi:hypothetical protein